MASVCISKKQTGCNNYHHHNHLFHRHHPLGCITICMDHLTTECHCKITLCSQNQIRLTMILIVAIILISIIVIIIKRPLIVIATVFVIHIIRQLHGKQQVLMIFISETKFLHLLFIHNAKQEFT